MDAQSHFGQQAADNNAELLFQSYFRVKIPEIDDETLLTLRRRPAWIRRHIAANTMHPAIIMALDRDQDPTVRQAVRNNLYWLYLGAHHKLNQMSTDQRRKIAARDDGLKLLPLLFFETDYGVIREALSNPHLPQEYLYLFRKYSQLRPLPGVDQQLQQLLSTQIKPYLRTPARSGSPNASLSDGQIQQLLKQVYLGQKSAIKNTRAILLSTSSRSLISSLRPNYPIWKSAAIPALTIWKICDTLRFRRPGKDLTGKKRRLLTILAMLKLKLLRYSARDLTETGHLIVLAFAHSDPNKALRNQAESLLDLKALFEILDDPGTPPGISLPALKALKKHPSATAKARAATALISVNKRAGASLREMEDSIKAYFDIIGNTRLGKVNGQKRTSQKGELTYLFEIITQLRALPEQIFNYPGINGSSVMATSHEQIKKARLLWQASVGQYLGRIKALGANILEEWLKHLNGNLTAEEFRRDFEKSNRVIEAEYKESVSCELSIDCSDCRKQTCAADRFLQQAEFLLAELLEFTDHEF